MIYFLKKKITMIYDNVKILVILNYLGLLQYYAQTKHYNVIIMVI